MFILNLYNNEFNLLKDHLSSYSFTDKETKEAMLEIYDTYNYIADPHGAVAYLGAKQFLNKVI